MGVVANSSDSCPHGRPRLTAARTFADAPTGELILYEDSYRSVAIAVSRGSAAAVLGVDEGAEIVLQIDVP